MIEQRKLRRIASKEKDEKIELKCEIDKEGLWIPYFGTLGDRGTIFKILVDWNTLRNIKDELKNLENLKDM